MIERFGDGGHEQRQALGDGTRPAGEVHDERTPADARRGAGENRCFHFLVILHPHDFPETGQFLFQHGVGRLRGDVARRGTGAAGGEDEGAVLLVRETAQGGLQHRAIVGQEHASPFQGLGKMTGREALDLRAASVSIDAVRRPVAEGDAGNFHDLRFSRTRMPPIDIVLSTALHMS